MLNQQKEAALAVASFLLSERPRGASLKPVGPVAIIAARRGTLTPVVKIQLYKLSWVALVVTSFTPSVLNDILTKNA